MSTQYDRIGKLYKSFKDLPPAQVEKPSVLKYLGNVKEYRCLDLACGFGNWSHFLIDQGASYVIGADISSAMIEEARSSIPQERKDRMDFMVGDCSKDLNLDPRTFDLAFGAWFLNYAPDYETMLKMWKVIYNNLKPGGRFVGITPNTFCPMFEPFNDCYGVDVRPIERVGERGWKCRLTAYIEPEPFQFEMFHFLHDVYENAATEAGMRDIKWHPAILPNDERTEGDFWDVYVRSLHASRALLRQQWQSVQSPLRSMLNIFHGQMLRPQLSILTARRL